jgi:hypothetical protein
MQVKRALKRAHKKDYLRLVPPVVHSLQEDLHERINERPLRKQPIRFHVVKDGSGPGYASVSARAAELVTQIILEGIEARAQRPSKSVRSTTPHDGPGTGPDIVVCNAGGRTISEMVRALQRNPPAIADPEDTTGRIKERLLFVAGNAAYLPEEFQRSANFISVTMAELFHANHLALPQVSDAQFRERYRKHVDRAWLFICGVGSVQTGLMAKYFADHHWEIPEQAVGDLAFNLLDESGEVVELPEEARRFMNQVNPSMSVSKLMHIASNNRVLLILDAEKPELKTKISVAALRREYATDVVLGSRLAQAILRELEHRDEG